MAYTSVHTGQEIDNGIPVDLENYLVLIYTNDTFSHDGVNPIVYKLSNSFNGNKNSTPVLIKLITTGTTSYGKVIGNAFSTGGTFEELYNGTKSGNIVISFLVGTNLYYCSIYKSNGSWTLGSGFEEFV